LWVVYKVVPATFNFKIGNESHEIAFMSPEQLKAVRPYINTFYELAK